MMKGEKMKKPFPLYGLGLCKGKGVYKKAD